MWIETTIFILERTAHGLVALDFVNCAYPVATLLKSIKSG